jgi:hypothetical protein
MGRTEEYEGDAEHYSEEGTAERLGAREADEPVEENVPEGSGDSSHEGTERYEGRSINVLWE